MGDLFIYVFQCNDNYLCLWWLFWDYLKVIIILDDLHFQIFHFGLQLPNISFWQSKKKKKFSLPLSSQVKSHNFHDSLI